ncbi:MAG: hypothetical protein ACKOCN_00190, partial [Planctomycetaceae bacterium]
PGRHPLPGGLEVVMPPAGIVGIFLAALELVRRGRLSTRQEQLFDEIWLEPAPPRSPASSSSTTPPPDAA